MSPRGGPAPAPGVGLVGAIAQALAPRLELSGYRALPLGGDEEPPQAPDLVVLSPDAEAWIPELRRRWGPLPLLLGIEDDTVAGRCRCLQSGADDFWLTSLGPSDLLTRLRLHCQRRSPSTLGGEPLRLADLSVDPQRRQVRRGQRSVELTAREYQLLLLLLRHRGSVVSRELILREIWEHQPRDASNVIEVYVRYLRRKLEEGGERRLIHTVRGQGYCLAEAPPRPRGGQRPGVPQPAQPMTSLNQSRRPLGRPAPGPWAPGPGAAGFPPARSGAPWGLGRAFGILALLCAAVRPASAAAPASAPAGPPQVLPLTARLCLMREPSAANPSPVCINLEEPRTPQQHAWGLMMRPPLPPRRGMWFAFQPAQPARFWMHRTPNPLDLVYIRSNEVVKIDRALPACMRLPCPIYGTEVPVDGVLEIGAGQAASLGITVGAAVRIEPLSASARRPPARD